MTQIDWGFLWYACKQETNQNENIYIGTKPPRSVSAKFLIREKIYMTDRPWRVENVSGLKWATELIHFNSREQLAFLCSTWGRREVWCGRKVQYLQKEFKPKMSACQLPISGPPSVLAEYLVLDEQMIQFTILIIPSLRITCSRKAWTWSASTPFLSHPASAPGSSQSTFQHQVCHDVWFEIQTSSKDKYKFCICHFMMFDLFGLLASTPSASSRSRFCIDLSRCRPIWPIWAKFENFNNWLEAFQVVILFHGPQTRGFCLRRRLVL